MKKKVRLALLPGLLFAVSCAPATASGVGAQSTVAVGAASITAEDMYARIGFFASEALQGRDTWSPGLEAAAAYIESEYRRFGLEPAGDDGTYFQRYPFTPRRSAAQQSGAVVAESYPANVAGILRGSDPELRDEYVVLTAHYDHVGIRRPVDGDSVYNGADDNASGSAGVLEIAEAFATLGERPRRSILFLHVSGEEHGLLGSRYYSDNPTVPVENIVANINLDMISRNSPDSIVVIGKDYSTLGDVVNRVGDRHPELNLVPSDDIWPEERFFYRSDHFNFARLEIPSLFFFAGVHEDYHQPSDEIHTIDPDKAARVSQLVFYTTQEIANAPGRPEWDPEGLAEVRALTNR